MQNGSKVQVFKKEKIHDFSFSKNINDSVHQFLKNAVCIKPWNINYSDTIQSYLPDYAT